LREKEKDTEYKHTLSLQRYVLVTNVNATNRYGNPRSYRILPLTMARFLVPDIHTKAMSWVKSQVTITGNYVDVLLIQLIITIVTVVVV